MQKIKRNSLVIALIIAGLTLFLIKPKKIIPIKVGVLHSLTGTMAQNEKPLVDAVRLAVNEINTKGGIAGRLIEIVVADGKSDATIFASEAKRLITEENVSVIFGCWTSASRKAVKPIVEQHNHLLFYPLQYEGLEQSPNIIYTGSTPNQQIIPAIRWAFKHLGKRVYLIGSDYIFPRTTSRIMADFFHLADAKLLAERYLPLSSQHVATVIQEIETLKPDVIFNTINGDTNEAFLQELSKSNAKDTPILSFSVTENQLKNSAFLKNHFAAWSYFQSIELPENQSFIENYQQLTGDKNRVTSDPIEATYVGVHLWAQAAKEAKSFEPEKVNEIIIKQSFHAPSGIVSIDAKTRHTWKMLRIGQAQESGQFTEVFHSDLPIRPTPFPDYRSMNEWKEIIAELNQGRLHD